MRNLTIIFSLSLIGTDAAWADEALAGIRTSAAAGFSPVSTQPVIIIPGGRATAFRARLKKIDGNKITLVRHVTEIEDKPETITEEALKEETLLAADDCKLLEPRRNRETLSVEWIPVEGGLTGDIDVTAFVTAQVRTNRENKIVEILADGSLGPRIPNRFQAIVKKIDGDTIQVKRIRSDETTLKVTTACKVFEARFIKEGLALVTEPVPGRLKAEVFSKEPVLALIATDKGKNVIEVCILRPNPHLFEAAITKIEGDKVTLVKRLADGAKGSEETIRSAATCAVFEYQMESSGKVSKVPYEPALTCEFLTMKRTELRVHTDKEHRVTKINVLHNPYWQEAVVKMDKLDGVRIFKETRDAYLLLAEDCRIFQGRVDRDTARTTYAPVKDGIKGAVVPKRPFHALVKQNDEDKVIEMRFHLDPANFVARVAKVEGNDTGEHVISIVEPALSAPGTKSKGAYGTELTASKDCRLFRRKSVGGKSVLEPVAGNNLRSLEPRVKLPAGGTQFVVARFLLGNDGRVTEVQILEGVTSVEEVK